MASQHILAGGLSGLVEITCTHPLDYMKVSLQQNKKIVFKEFYRGILSRYTSVFPMRSILWGCRNTGVRILKNRNIIEKGSAIGSTAGVLQTFVDAPLENIKIQQMYHNKVDYSPKNLIRGFTPNMARNIILCCGIITGSLVDDKVGLLAGSAIGCLLSQPFDYIKTMQQTGIEGEYKNMMRGWQYRIAITPLNMLIGYNIYKWLIVDEN